MIHRIFKKSHFEWTLFTVRTITVRDCSTYNPDLKQQKLRFQNNKISHYFEVDGESRGRCHW